MKLKALLIVLLITFSGTITAQEDGLMDAL
jgi:hypothetical protein